MRNAAILLAGPLLAFLFVMTDVWAMRYGGDTDSIVSSTQFARREAQLRDARGLLSQLNTYYAQSGDRSTDPRVAWSDYFADWNSDHYEWSVDADDPSLFALTGDAALADVHALCSAIDQDVGPWIVEELSMEPGERGARFRMLIQAPREEGEGG